MPFHKVTTTMKWVLVVTFIASGYVSCNPTDSQTTPCEGAQCTVDEAAISDAIISVQTCDPDPGAERRTELLENAAITWGSTLPPMLVALNEISHTLKLQQEQPRRGVQRAQGMDCSVLYEQGYNTSGVYRIGSHAYSVVDHEPFHAYCDMETDGGGWTVFQRRFDGSTNFYRVWDQYAEGFGHVDSEYWLGLKKISLLTSFHKYELRIDLEDFSGNKAYALYSDFHMKDAYEMYELHLDSYSGTAGDALYSGTPFTTKDSDNDNSYNQNCAGRWKGAWWYNDCHNSNLNGRYIGVAVDNSEGMVWKSWKYEVLKVSEMKIRRKV